MNSEAWLAIAVVTLGVGTVLSTLLQSLRDLSKSTLEEIATIRGNRGASERVSHILEDQDGHAAAIGLPRTICNLAFALALLMWVSKVRGGPTAGPEWPDLLIAIIVASLGLWIFGSVLPNSIARYAGEGTVYAWSPLIRAIYLAGGPLASLARMLDEIVRRLSGREAQNAAQAAQQELLEAVDEATVEGKVDATEKEMLQAVVHFRDKTVAQVMTPRTEIESMALINDLSAVTAAIRRIGHSRIPVYEGSLDHVVGIFYVKDLMKWLAGESARSGKVFSLKALCRPVYFVPDSKTIRELLDEMMAKRTHIAMVADEYGGTAGLVTIEDIIEEVFGDIADEYEEPPQALPDVVVEPGVRAAAIDARLYIRDANDALRELEIELPQSEDYDTVGGFVTVTLGRIPGAGETFEHDGLVVTVLGAEPTRVTRVRVEGRSPRDDGADQPAEPEQEEARR